MKTIFYSQVKMFLDRTFSIPWSSVELDRFSSTCFDNLDVDRVRAEFEENDIKRIKDINKIY